MKEKKGRSIGKLELNRQTVADLTAKEMDEIRGRAYEPCWENLWTLYYCKVIYSGDPE